MENVEIQGFHKKIHKFAPRLQNAEGVIVCRLSPRISIRLKYFDG